MDLKSRREFLQSLSLLLGYQYFSDFAEASESEKKIIKETKELKKQSSGSLTPNLTNAHYKIAPWKGDDFTLGHKFRAGQLPNFPEKAERKVDFVIVGGGVSGLTSAYKLRDHDILLLEQYDELGGQSRGSSFQGIKYSYAAAYVGSINGEYGKFYSELGLEPVAAPPERNAFWWENKWCIGAEENNCPSLKKEFKKLIQQAKPIWDAMPEEPEPTKMLEGGLSRLDQCLFISELKGYSKEFLSLIDSFCKSAFCGGIEQLSALAGYGLIIDLVETMHVFKGGNSALGQALANKVDTAGKNRAVKGAFVWHIDIKENGASVVYSTQDGAVHRIDCRHVIVATPPLVAARQMFNIPDTLKGQLLSFRFGSYLVANLLMKQKLFNGVYDCFAGAPYTFSDITVAETPYLKTNSYKKEMGSVLTVYHPYPAGSIGRSLLLVGNKEQLSNNIVEQINKIQPGLKQGIDEVVLSRWGHALAIIGPSYFKRLEKVQAHNQGAFSLSHSSIYGWAAAESAIRGGKLAAQRALQQAASTKQSIIKESVKL